MKVICEKCGYKWVSMFDNRPPVMCTKCKQRGCVIKDTSLDIRDMLNNSDHFNCPFCKYEYIHIGDCSNSDISFWCEGCGNKWLVQIKENNGLVFNKIKKL